MAVDCKNPDLISANQESIAGAYAKDKQYVLAASFFKQCLDVCRKNNLINTGSIATGDLGNMQVQMAGALPAGDPSRKALLANGIHELAKLPAFSERPFGCL